MKNIIQTVGRVLTGIKEHSTKEKPPNTMPFKRLKLDWNFDTEGEPKLSEMLEAAKQFTNEIHNQCKPRWLTYLGASGNGKTHLSRRIARYWTDTGRWYVHPQTGANCTRTGFLCDWRSVSSDLKGGDFRLIEDLIELDFLAIDDMGAEYDPSGFIKSGLDRLLNSRRGKWTVITSNLTKRQVGEQLDTRILSRLFREGGVVVESDLMDYEIRRRKNL